MTTYIADLVSQIIPSGETVTYGTVTGPDGKVVSGTKISPALDPNAITRYAWIDGKRVSYTTGKGEAGGSYGGGDNRLGVDDLFTMADKVMADSKNGNASPYDIAMLQSLVRMKISQEGRIGDDTRDKLRTVLDQLPDPTFTLSPEASRELAKKDFGKFKESAGLDGPNAFNWTSNDKFHTQLYAANSAILSDMSKNESATAYWTSFRSQMWLMANEALQKRDDYAANVVQNKTLAPDTDWRLDSQLIANKTEVDIYNLETRMIKYNQSPRAVQFYSWVFGNRSRFSSTKEGGLGEEPDTTDWLLYVGLPVVGFTAAFIYLKKGM